MASSRHGAGDVQQPLHLGMEAADGVGHRGVGAPAVELAAGVDADDVAFLEHAAAGDAVHHFVVDRHAADGGKGRFARHAFEERNGVALGEVAFDGGIDACVVTPGRNQRADEAMGAPIDDARLAHLRQLARRLEIRQLRELCWWLEVRMIV